MRRTNTPPDSQDLNSDLQSGDDCVLVDELAHEFAERLRNGERVTIADYAEQHPRLADEIKDLFPAIVTMEQLTKSKKNAAAKNKGLSVEQLGDYRIIGEIARGGMGIVYEAEQVSLGRRVAMKVLPAQSLRSKNELLRFQREARTAARLHHTNVVPVFGVGEQDGYHYIVMQYIEGVGLDEVLSELRTLVLDQSPVETDAKSTRSSYAKHNAKSLLKNRFAGNFSEETIRQDAPQNTIDHSFATTESNLSPDSTSRSSEFPADQSKRPTDGKPTDGAHESPQTLSASGYESLPAEYWRSVADIGVQAAEALAYAHSSRTLHRDVKPGNLLLDIHGNVWIADFGLAKAIEAEHVTWTGDIVGTLSYMAPERFRDETDARSDVYGLGLTLYELLTLKRAFDGSERASLIHRVANDPIQPPRKLNPQIPRDLETIVLKATAKDPADRYQTASAMASDLRCFVADAPIAARRSGPIERLSRWCRRNKTVAALTASVATLLIVSSTLATVGYFRETMYRRNAESTSQMAFDAFDRLYDQLATNMDVPQDLTQSYSAFGRTPQEPEIPLSTEAAAALASLLEFYDKLSTQSATSTNSTKVRTRAMIASRRVGDIHLRLSESERALVAFRRALSIAETIDDSKLQTDALRIEYARVLNGMGLVQSKNRQQKDATESHTKAIQLVEGIETPAAKFELARAHAIMQKLQPRKNRDHVQQAIATLEDLVDSNDATPQHQLLLARCLSCQFLPNQKCATREQALYILEQLVCDYPEAPEYRYELGRIYSEAQLCCISDGESMLEAQQKADKATKPFDFAYVDVPRYVELKSDIFQRLAKAWQAKNETKLAADFYQKAIDKERLLYSSDKLDGQRARHGNRLAEYHILRALTLKSMDVNAAKLELEAAMQILTPLKNDSTNGEIAKSSELLTNAQQQYERLTGV